MSGLIGSPLLQPAELLASLAETFTSGLSTVRSPSPLPDMTTVATGQFPPAGLSPTGSTTSVAAPRSGLHHHPGFAKGGVLAANSDSQRGRDLGRVCLLLTDADFIDHVDRIVGHVLKSAM